MASRAIAVRYRYREGGDAERNASFHGRLYNRTEAAVLRRLREVHRFADRVEIVEMRALERPRMDGATARGSTDGVGGPA